MILGIDLGTTNSAVSYWDGECYQLIPNVFGDLLTPSAVGLTSEDEVIVGRPALEQRTTHPNRTATAFKRKMGTAMQIRLGERVFRAEELSALVLKTLKADAEAHLGQPIEEAIITVPAYFNDLQRKATRQAGELAGLKVERLVNEPTAASLAFSLNREIDGTYLVFDLGGGTFDVSLVEIFEGVVDVRSSCGDNYLGGEDFVDLLVQGFMQKNHLSESKLNEIERQRLHALMERSKCRLSTEHSVESTLAVGENSWAWTVDRTQFGKISEPLLRRIYQPLRQAIHDSRIKPSELDGIIMVGGATRMLMVRDLVVKTFKKFPLTGIDPDLVVAAGAGVLAGMKQRSEGLKERVLTDVCPYTLGTGVSRELARGLRKSGFFLPIIERNTPIPVSRETELVTVEDNQMKMTIDIYQGEGRKTSENIYLEELSVNVPPRKAGEEQVVVRFTYDINGLLEVDVTVASTGERKSVIIEQHKDMLSQEEIREALARIEELKIHPRDLSPVRATMNRAERLYKELLGDEREFLSNRIAQMEAVLERQNRDEVEPARLELEKILDDLDF